MTNTGHNDLAQAIAENLKRRATHTREVHSRDVPQDVLDRVAALEGAMVDFSAQLLQLVADFAAHTHKPPEEMKELAERVQRLEQILAKRAA